MKVNFDMKKRTAFIGAILSLIPLGQPLLIKTGVVLSSSAVMLSLPQKVNAESFDFYFDLGLKKVELGDYKGSIKSFSDAINVNPNYTNAWLNRGISKEKIGDMIGACADYKYLADWGVSKGKRYYQQTCTNTSVFEHVIDIYDAFDQFNK